MDEPWRTTMALVKAAKVMVIAAIPTHTPVLEAGELSSTARELPLAGIKLPFPPELSAPRRVEPIFGGS